MKKNLLKYIVPTIFNLTMISHSVYSQTQNYDYSRIDNREENENITFKNTNHNIIVRNTTPNILTNNSNNNALKHETANAIKQQENLEEVREILNTKLWTTWFGTFCGGVSVITLLIAFITTLINGIVTSSEYFSLGGMLTTLFTSGLGMFFTWWTRNASIDKNLIEFILKVVFMLWVGILGLLILIGDSFAVQNQELIDYIANIKDNPVTFNNLLLFFSANKYESTIYATIAGISLIVSGVADLFEIIISSFYRTHKM